MQVNSFLSIPYNSFESFEGEGQNNSWFSTIVDMNWKKTFFIEYKIVGEKQRITCNISSSARHSMILGVYSLSRSLSSKPLSDGILLPCRGVPIWVPFCLLSDLSSLSSPS
jgi:hypothetical protein